MSHAGHVGPPKMTLRVMGDSSDKMWSAGEGNGNPLQYSCLENPMNSMERHLRLFAFAYKFLNWLANINNKN